MQTFARSTCAMAAIGAAVAGCQTAPVHYAGVGARATYDAAGAGVSTIRTAGGEIYTGAGRAIRRPFQDLNMLQEQIPPVLLRAESHPYDLSRVNSCNDVLDQVAELDLALGPDVDTPKVKRRRTMRNADFAASAALDAAGSAVDHFIPMRSTIRQITGAQRYDNHVKHAVLAGTTRRSFLKAVGMAHNCTWPAAPLDFAPSEKVDVAALWVAPSPAAPPVRLASAPVLAPAPGAAMPVAVLTSASGGATGPAPVLRLSRVTVISAGAAPPPLRVAVGERLVLPSAAPPAQLAAQSWRPPPAVRRSLGGARLVEVSAAVAPSAGAASPAPAPWASNLVVSSARP